MPNAKILVVEDEAPIAQLIERSLRNSGYTVCASVGSGEEAIEEAKRLHPDLVLMDITLTGSIDGVETARRLYAEFDVPVVFLTGMGNEETIERSQDAKAFGFVLKPFRPEEIRASIDIALEKHRAESKLRRVEHWFSAAIRSISDAVITTNEHGAITFINPVAASLTGWAEPKAVGRALEEVFRATNTDGEFIADDFLKLALNQGRPAHTSGPLMMRTNGRPAVSIEASASPIRNDHGQIVGLVLIFRDITERQRAEAALRESEERFHVFMNNSPAVAFIKDEEGRYLYGNRAWATRFGKNPEEMLGKTDFELWPEDTARMFRRSDAAAFASAQPIEWIESAARPDGTPYHAMIFKFILGGAAGRKLLGGLALDITASKEAEAEVNRSREQLRSLAAHLQSVREEERSRISREIHDQLGQMLTGLKMDVAWLERRLTAAEKTALALILDKTQSMAELLDRMVTSVRRISSELRPGVLDDLGLVPALEWQAREFQAHTTIECRLSSTLNETPVPPEIGTAAFRIFQETLTNVARHAKATAVAAELKAQDGALIMQIRDNGRGITQKDLMNLKSLGLLGMRERASILGGDFKIAGEPGKGTTVTVRIPLAQQKQSEMQTVREASVNGQTELSDSHPGRSDHAPFAGPSF